MGARDTINRIRERAQLAIRPLVTITPPPDGIRFEHDVEVPVRDGTILRVNVFRPDDDEPHPVLLCAHPYGKDAMPAGTGAGAGNEPPAIPRQLHLLPQSQPWTMSGWTSWEAPDPAHWVPSGYVLVNADLRGWGTSDGVGELLSAQEAEDYHDLIEWAAVQGWSNGRVGLNGVSYLAIAQWGAAAERPAHLAAICPWEGFTDAYRDLCRPGGVREDGFVVLWSTLLKAQRRSPVTVREEQVARPRFDPWWKARLRDIEAIDVPALVCGSFSDHNLHSGGSFDGFERIASRQKWLYTHRGPKWATYYGADALAFQERFFDHFLRGDANGMPDLPPVRLEVRETADDIVDVRHETSWPLAQTEWRPLHLDARDETLRTDRPAAASAVGFEHGSEHVSFRYLFDEDTELTGPMSLRLHVSTIEADDVSLFAGVRKWHDGQTVGFEGSYGFRSALVTCGWLKVSHRAPDVARSAPWAPRHLHLREDPVPPGEIVAVDLALQPSATLFRGGDELELIVQGRWFFSRNPLLGPFPAAYERSGPGRTTLHTGGAHDAHLLVPVIPHTG